MLQISERSLSRAGRESGNSNNNENRQTLPPPLTLNHSLTRLLSLSTFLSLSLIHSLIACFCFLSVSLASASGGTFPFSLVDITSHTPLSLSTLYLSVRLTRTRSLLFFHFSPPYLSGAYVLIVIIYLYMHIICHLFPAKKLRRDKYPRREEKCA
ncbi:hypothetical protein Peur_017610 [Populus x canadensis]